MDVIKFDEIKKAMRYINNANMPLIIRRNMIFHGETNELLAIIKYENKKK